MILKTLIFSLVITAVIMLVMFINKKFGKKAEFRVSNCNTKGNNSGCAGCHTQHETDCTNS